MLNSQHLCILFTYVRNLSKLINLQLTSAWVFWICARENIDPEPLGKKKERSAALPSNEKVGSVTYCKSENKLNGCAQIESVDKMNFSFWPSFYILENLSGKQMLKNVWGNQTMQWAQFQTLILYEKQ